MFNCSSRVCTGFLLSHPSLRLFIRPISLSTSTKLANKFRRDVLTTAEGDNGVSTSGGPPVVSSDDKNFVQFVGARLCLPADPKFAAIELIPRDDSLSISNSSKSLRIPLVWLRDHCRSPTSYNSRTNQRRSDCTDLFNKATLADDCYPVHFDADNQKLTVSWADGYESLYGIRELLRWAVFSPKQCVEEWEGGAECPSRSLWDANGLREVPSVPSTNFDFALFARLFIRFGVVAVNGVNSSNGRATRELCESVATLFGTIFGDFWTFGPGLDTQNEMESHDDTAYGNDAIGPHTDGTYLDQPPGIQVFHCLRPAPRGGQTLLVDGFAVAERLRTDSADLFGVLNTTSVEHEYLEGDRFHCRAFREPVIRQFPGTEKVAQIRFNPYDRAPMRTLKMDDGQRSAFENTILFYEAYQRFAQFANDSAHKVMVNLRPGTVLFIDNFRVLHGRNAFQGERVMCGCYLNRDVLLAKARPKLSPEFYRNV
uniref:Trimethyllysine dioxygenase, mitochondrial n=1 Tax=Globodera rostochiensis TaxID=31243 RepID=A0A914GTW3_GLORO